ncbi:DNA metabolism protein [Lithospermum erythrorhizon]|uniref:DNA metabolism protein n=1 Tax=Lithospermum erythrorhizon TaxID=34254 RepID=A0AAV3QKD0_LITER
MNHSRETSGLKRKKPEPDVNRFLTDQDRAVLSAIKKKEDTGMFKGDIKIETKLIDRDLNKALKNLESHNLIKVVVNIKNKTKKHYVAVEFKPSKEISGGVWYKDGNLDTEHIQKLKYLCSIVTKKAATLDAIHDLLKKRAEPDLKKEQVSEILTSMVLSNELIEVKSTGYGEFHSIPIGTLCYKVASAAGIDKGPKVGAMASIPCGACPRISKCTPDGLISPSTCVYFTKWLDISF